MPATHAIRLRKMHRARFNCIQCNLAQVPESATVYGEGTLDAALIEISLSLNDHALAVAPRWHDRRMLSGEKA